MVMIVNSTQLVGRSTSTSTSTSTSKPNLNSQLYACALVSNLDKSHALGFLKHIDGIFRGFTVANPLNSPAWCNKNLS